GRKPVVALPALAATRWALFSLSACHHKFREYSSGLCIHRLNVGCGLRRLDSYRWHNWEVGMQMSRLLALTLSTALVAVLGLGTTGCGKKKDKDKTTTAATATATDAVT